MYECEQINQQLTNCHLFASSTLNFLQKHLCQYHKALLTYSIVLKHIHTKSINLLRRPDFNHQTTEHLHHAFISFTQTFADEYYHLEQRTSSLKTIQSTIEQLQQQMNTSKTLKHKAHKYTYSIIRLNRQKKRQYRYQLIQQIRKHDKLTVAWRDNLDDITSKTTNLLWKLFSYSPYKYDVKRIRTSSNSLSNSEQTVDVPCFEANHQDDHLAAHIELGAGDQFRTKLTREKILVDCEQKQMSNSNNALVMPVNARQSDGEHRSTYSTDIDEIMVEKNRLYDEIIDDEDVRWMNIVKQNELQWQQTKTVSVSSEPNSNESESIVQRNRNIMATKDALHLSDLSYTTDYYSQNESD